MKRSIIIATGALLLGVCSFVNAQNSDTTSTNLNTQTPVEESQQNQNNTQSDDMKTQDAERADSQKQPQSTDQQLEKDVEQMQQNFEGSTIDKVGPNGEKLFMERGKYFYINDEGKKVKVKKSEVRDQSEMQQQP
jgi:hypothetical protein